jgi:predicted RNA binding protein YcfA (HicA-like mRNA interferase family)
MLKFHLHFADDFVEAEHPRKQSGPHAGQFAKKGETGTGGGFAPTVKKIIPANEIAHTLKAKGFAKTKQTSPGGHAVYHHTPSGTTVFVGPSKENQTYSKGFRFGQGGPQGAGGKELAKALEKHLEGRGEEPKQETATSGEVHPLPYVAQELTALGFKPEKSIGSEITYSHPDGGSLMVSQKATNKKVGWSYKGPGAAEWTHGVGIKNGTLQNTIELTKSQPKTEPEKTAVKADPFISEKMSNIGFKPAKELTSSIQFENEKGDKIFVSKKLDESHGNYNWVYEGEGGHKSGNGLANLANTVKEFNAAFEALHPRGEGGKFIAKPNSGGDKIQHADKDVEDVLNDAGAKVVNNPGPGAWDPVIYQIPGTDIYARVLKGENPNFGVFKGHPDEGGTSTGAGEVKGAKALKEHLEQAGIQFTPAAPKSSAISPKILNKTDLKEIGPQLGSKPGAQYQDPDGDKYYVKQPQSVNHARNELLAAALFRAAGGNTLDYHQVVDGDKLGVGTKLVTLEKNNIDQLTPNEKAEAQKDFAIHAWLANWDAAGLTGGNYGVVNGKVTPLDFGGSLLYRTKGDEKGLKFDNNANEWETLRNPLTNPASAKLFGGMSAQQLKQSAERLKAIKPDQIKDLVNQYGPGDFSQKVDLLQKLIARRESILVKAQQGLVGAAPSIKPEKQKVPVDQLANSIKDASTTYFESGYSGAVSQKYSKAYNELQTHSPEMDPNESSALSSYKGAGYQSMNQSARQGSKSHDPQVKRLTDYLNKCSTPTDMMVVRRVKNDFASSLTSIVDVGTRWKERGFVSASLDPERLKGWGEVTLIIQVPKGMKGAAVNNENESEVLFQRDITYLTCLHIDHDTKTYICRMDQKGSI